MGPLPRNLELDRRTVSAMVHIYCHDRHATDRHALCDKCAALASYAAARLEKCLFGEDKTTCRECPIHCYRPAERRDMKDVMRYAGSRMLVRHPILAIRHLLLERKGPPPWPPRARRTSYTTSSPQGEG